jgi:hypothetical protein
MIGGGLSGNHAIAVGPWRKQHDSNIVDTSAGQPTDLSAHDSLSGVHRERMIAVVYFVKRETATHDVTMDY